LLLVNEMCSSRAGLAVASAAVGKAKERETREIRLALVVDNGNADNSDRPRIRKPRDKAKAEVAVQIVQRFVLARLHNRRFFSIEELNVAIRECVAELNASHAQTRQERARAV
jgi:hypothetical protein